VRTLIRQCLDKAFTSAAAGSVLLIAAVLLVVLIPMFKKGLSAVFFTETIEFRRLQKELHDRGDERTETGIRAGRRPKPVYDMLAG
jgi:hypothetical protein